LVHGAVLLVNSWSASSSGRYLSAKPAAGSCF
jgi:hypothetical protein